MTIYAIKNWDENYEIAQSRQCKGMKMSWVAVPNRHDGKGFRRLVRNPNNVQVFCAWNLIIQVASKQKIRGRLEDTDGPLTAEDLSDKTGFPEEIFQMAFEVLSDPKIGWLEVVT